METQAWFEDSQPSFEVARELQFEEDESGAAAGDELDGEPLVEVKSLDGDSKEPQPLGPPTTKKAKKAGSEPAAATSSKASPPWRSCHQSLHA